MADRPYMCRDEGLFLPECDDCSQLEGRVKALEDCCETATEELADHEERISSAESDIDTLQEDLMSAQSDIQSNTDAIDSIERLPEVTSADDGKVLTVVDGRWGIKPSSLVGEAIVGQSTVGEEETESDIDELKERMLSAESNIASLEENKQNKLTAGAGIQIQNDVISTTGSGDEGKADYTRIDECNDIVSFQADAKGVPLKSLTATVNPKQDLHGYDKPWSEGSGKNKWNGTFVNASFAELGSFTSPCYAGNNAMPIKVGTVYSASMNGTLLGIRYVFLDANKNAIGDFVNANSTVSAPTDAVYLRWRTRDEATASGLYQIEEGSTATAWTPYSNICPIGGWDSVDVTRTGKNLLSKLGSGTLANGGLTFERSGDGSINISGTSTAVYPQCALLSANPVNQKILPIGATVTLSCTTENVPSGAKVYAIYYERDTSTSFQNVKSHSTINGSVTFTTETAYAHIIIVAQNTGITYSETVANMQLELGTTATAYEPYTGNTYTTDLPETVYGGSLDVVNGVLTVTWEIKQISDLTWTKFSVVQGTLFRATLSDGASDYNSTNFISSAYNTTTSTNRGNGTISCATAGVIDIIDNNYSDASSFKSAMGTQTIVYELAEPRTIQLTPKQVTTLLGTNNVWADSGEVCLEYEHTQGVPTLKARKTTYTTTESSEGTFALTDYTASDILFVYVNGLMLVEGDEYTIVGTNVVLTTPITHTGTVVHIVALQAR